MTDNTFVCGVRFEHVKHITMHVVPSRNISSKSEANAPDLLEHLEDIFTRFGQ